MTGNLENPPIDSKPTRLIVLGEKLRGRSKVRLKITLPDEKQYPSAEGFVTGFFCELSQSKSDADIIMSVETAFLERPRFVGLTIFLIEPASGGLRAIADCKVDTLRGYHVLDARFPLDNPLQHSQAIDLTDSLLEELSLYGAIEPAPTCVQDYLPSCDLRFIFASSERGR